MCQLATSSEGEAGFLDAKVRKATRIYWGKRWNQMFTRISFPLFELAISGCFLGWNVYRTWRFSSEKSYSPSRLICSQAMTAWLATAARIAPLRSSVEAQPRRYSKTQCTTRLSGSHRSPQSREDSFLSIFSAGSSPGTSPSGLNAGPRPRRLTYLCVKEPYYRHKVLVMTIGPVGRSGVAEASTVTTNPVRPALADSGTFTKTLPLGLPAN